MKEPIVIGSRESVLAVAQSELVRAYLREGFPEMEVEILTMKTAGDRILGRPLEQIGGKGLFVKELDRALLAGETDLSVHSLKDVPMELPEGLGLVAFSRREDPRDVLVLPEGQEAMDFSKPIGCSSRRRMAQFQRLYPQARFATIRGNVQTRLKRLDEGEFGGTLLAAAGLKRLGLERRISRYFTTEEMIPAAGQGILAVEARAEDARRFLDHSDSTGHATGLLAGFHDGEAAACAIAERAFVRGLGGGCTEPIAACAKTEGERLTLRGFYRDEKAGKEYRGSLSGPAAEAERIGLELARALGRKSEGRI